MNELQQYLELMLKTNIKKIIISNPATKSEEYKKIIVENKGKTYQISKYTDKQVFHENLMTEELLNRCMELIQGHYRQVNGISETEEHIILISK